MQKIKHLTFNILLVLVAAFAVGGIAGLRIAGAQIEDVTNFTGVQAKATALGTATPLAEFWRQSNTGDTLLIRDARGTPRIRVAPTSGAMTVDNLTLSTVVAPVVGYPTPGIICNRNTQTITDTATFTSTVTAITTPSSVMCSMNAITGDAANCRAVVGTPGSVIVSVVNTALTPAANATGAGVTFETCGTN
jgi:hypothetical protein